MTPSLEQQIEEAYIEARAIHENGMDPRMIELDRKGEWLHKTWFKAGYLNALAKNNAIGNKAETKCDCVRIGEELKYRCEQCRKES